MAAKLIAEPRKAPATQASLAPAPAAGHTIGSPAGMPAFLMVQAKCAQCEEEEEEESRQIVPAVQAKCAACAGEDDERSVQTKADSAPVATAVHAAAREGVAGADQPLPHLDRIQGAFGRHDVTGAHAAIGGPAATANRRMGSLAYTAGDRVAFRRDPDVKLAAHEAAHLVQQRSGAKLPDGVGRPGDAYEQQADAVAEAVDHGQSAEPILDCAISGGLGAAPVVQHALDLSELFYGPDSDDPDPETLYRRYFGFPNVDVDKAAEAMGKKLRDYVLKHPDPYAFILQVFEHVPDRHEDNVAAAFVSLLDDLQLDQFALNERGRAALDMLYEAMITGDVSGFERYQAARIELYGLPNARKRQAGWERFADYDKSTPESLVNWFLELLASKSVDTAAEYLAHRLRYRIDRVPDANVFVRDVFQKLPGSYEDNVGAEFMALLDASRLHQFAASDAGRAALDIVYEALITGDVSDFQRFEADRIIQARNAATPIGTYLEYQKRRRIFPVKYQKFLRDCYSAPKAELQADGQVKVHYVTNRIWQCSEFKEDVATLGVGLSKLMDGFLLKPDEIVSVRLYDSDEKVLDIPAIQLIDYSNESQNRSLALGEQAFLAGLTLPLGGLPEAGLARALAIADRVAWGISVVSTLINDNREWIAKLPFGEELLDAVDSVNRLAGYYGWARLGYEGVRFAGAKLRPAWQSWHGQPKLNLNEAEAEVVQKLDTQVENVLKDLDQAERQAADKAAAEVKPAAPGDTAQPVKGEPAKVEPAKPAKVEPAQEPQQLDPRITEKANEAGERAREAKERLKTAGDDLKRVFTGAGGKAQAVLPSLTLMAAKKLGTAAYRLLAFTYFYARSRAISSFEMFLRSLEQDGLIERATLTAQEKDAIRQAFRGAQEMSASGNLPYGRQIYRQLSKRAQRRFGMELVDMMAAEGKALGKTDQEIIEELEAKTPARKPAVIESTETPGPGNTRELHSKGRVGDAPRTRPGLEAKYPLGKDVGLPGMVRYHVEGVMAIGDERNIVYAPDEFNNASSPTGRVEKEIRNWRENTDDELFYDFKVQSHFHGEHDGVSIWVLDSITWKLERRALGTGKIETVFEYTGRP